MDNKQYIKRSTTVFSITAIGLLPLLGVSGCGEEKLSQIAAPSTQPTPSTTAPPMETTTPAVSPTPTMIEHPKTNKTAQPDDKPVERPLPLMPLVKLGSPLESGWITILSRTESGAHGWVEGEIRNAEKLTITTGNTNRFRLDLTRLRLDWEKGIVFRLDGSNSELTRKRWPAIVFERTPSGGWVVEED